MSSTDVKDKNLISTHGQLYFATKSWFTYKSELIACNCHFPSNWGGYFEVNIKLPGNHDG